MTDKTPVVDSKRFNLLDLRNIAPSIGNLFKVPAAPAINSMQFDVTSFGFAPVTAPALVPTETVPPAAPVLAPVAALALSTKTSLQGKTLFGSNKADINAQGGAALDQLATTLEVMDYDLVITVGHTDSVGSDAFNQKLSEQRAAGVRSYLISKGVDASRIQSQGRGEKEPLASNATAQGRAQNRRVEIEVTGHEKP